ncbi:MAG TPA: hypothetical protein VN517_03800 [Terriglobales bacterium]|nr:hypothetical protein [Terriglobales bacterium]
MANYTEKEQRLLDEIESHELDCRCDLCMEFVNSHNSTEWKATVAARLEVPSE